MEVRETTLGGRYTLLAELGSGGMAVVWRARDEVLGRSVAVKVLAGRFAGDAQSRGRIRHEARAAAALSHPNIAQVYDYGESTRDGELPLPYVVMELVNGPTLQQRVASGPLPPRTAFRVCGEVAAALAAAHSDGLVHRDIKMANIMVTTGGAKVVDFGIAAAIGRAGTEEMLVGTPAYLAPERLTGDAIQPASDIYALGILLYRLLADEPPWTVETTTQMLTAHIYIEPAPLPDLPGVPGEVADLIARCLAKDPLDRPTASQVSETLGDAAEAAIIDVRDAGAPAPAGPLPDAWTEAVAGSAGPIPNPMSGPISNPITGPTTSPIPCPREVPAAERVEPAPVVPRGKRKALVAGGVVAAVTVAGLGLWGLTAAGGDGHDVAERAGTGVSAAPSAAASGRPAPSATATGTRVTPSITVTRSGGVASVTASEPVGAASPSVSGSPGASASPSDGSTASAPATTDPQGQRLTSAGGVVYAECTGGNAVLTWWEPADGFTVQSVNPGPALTAEIVFQGTLARYRMTVTCVAGSPTPLVLPL